ncbi:PREDICTED: RNA exonuclease 1 homolog isoform X2 [Polistes canadensis]|uniref:RNA exonuclease 1 homolog isoform X2 n=1 Tax=Polistes canadensis TaxID=91411 RepID=UPI000718D54F|nr:PREDICTED: RNA exonuclease 1 homolog isoform X2 [Polistes canadensis]
MLPSTGYFKTINCPFYENGLCERPYCHFKHAKRDAGNTAGMVGVVETQATGQTQTKSNAAIAASNSDMLQQLVTEAVKKVLADQEVTDTDKFSKTIVSQVVEGLKKPSLTSDSASSSDTTTSNIIGKHMNIPTTITKPVPCVYNPTPIAELKKRHIPVVSYMPTRENRVAVKRKSSPDRIKPWLSIIKDPTSSQTTEITYKPTAISCINDQDSIQSYIPTFKSDSSSSNSYEDSNSNDNIPKVKEAYYPKSKKRREEYVPKKVKAPLKNVQQLDDTVLDQFEPEFDMIGEILTAATTALSTVPSEESQDYCLDIEPKFSDDEPMPDDTKEKYESNVYKSSLCNNEKKSRDNVHDSKTVDKKRKLDEVENELINNHHNIDDTVDDKTKSKKRRESSDNVKEKHKERRKDEDRIKKDHRSSSRSSDKHKKDHNRSGKSSKESKSYKSSSSDKRHSSSSSSSHKDKEKNKNSHSSKESTHKSKERSSHKDKDSSAERSNKDKHKSSKHDKHKSKTYNSSSKSDKHSSSKSHRNHRSRSHHRSRSRDRMRSPSKKDKHEEENDDNKINTLLNERESLSPAESLPGSFENIIFDSSDSETDVQEECLKIFQEYKVSNHPKVVSIKESAKVVEIEENEEFGKKRVAHPSAAMSMVSRQVGPSQPPKRLPNPQQKMYERWRLMREAAAEKAAEKAAGKMASNVTKTQITPTPVIQQPANNVNDESVESVSTINNNEFQMNGHGRIRIAHVPYAMSLAMKKKQVKENIVKTNDSKAIDNKTIAQTSKGGVRVAHVSQVVPQLIRPEPLQPMTQKFPLNVRQYYINIMQDICVQIYTNGDDAAQRAVREEFTCHEKCKALTVYKNSCMLAAHRLRKEVDQNRSSDGSNTTASGTVSHEAVLAGKSKGSWSVLRTKKAITDFKGSALYSMLKKWIMTEEQLQDNGFPRAHPEGTKGRAKVYVINSRNQTVLSKVPNERICSRCGQNYMVDKQGFPVQQQNCIYHWGRKFTIKGEGKYSCCQQYGSATGCCDAKFHVWNYTDYENLRGYIKTLPKDIAEEEQGVYALDCEMCYTTQGLELTRITVINDECNVIYETLVKPQNPIVDYNTRFSGITENDMTDVTTTLLEVQATLLAMFSNKTILVGHSLESDFKALRLLHDTVVDTSVMFPHRNGYPQKRALKNLCSEYLRKIIQNDVGGHDSKEDAVACMELVLWKVKEEAKLQ